MVSCKTNKIQGVLSLLFVLVLTLPLIGCGGNSGSSRRSSSVPPTASEVLEGDLVPAISGVNYSTASLNGNTDEAGLFRYSPGETVQFTLGETALGSARGGPEITLADLSQTKLLVGTDELRRVVGLDWHPFHFLINRAVFLYSLDADNNPGNGIEITAEIVDLMGDTIISFEEDWRDFHSEYALRKLLVEAYEAGVYDSPRPVAGLAASMTALYRAIGVSPAIHGITEQGLSNSDWADPSQSTVLRVIYDDRGYPLSRSFGGYLPLFEKRYNEQEKMVWKKYLWCYESVLTYSPYGYLQRSESVAFDEDFRPSTVIYQLGPYGNTLRREVDEFNDGTVDHYEAWQYNEQGLAVRHERTGVSHYIIETEYDDHGNVIYVDKLHIDGANSSTETYEYDALNRRIVAEIDRDRDGGIDRRYEWEYFENGGISNLELARYGEESTQDTHSITTYDLAGRKKTVRESRGGYVSRVLDYDQTGRFVTTEYIDNDGDGVADSIRTEARGADWRLIYRTWDHDADGTVDERVDENIKYNARGQPTYSGTDRDGDGVMESELSFTYDAHGNLIRQEFREYDTLWTFFYQYDEIGWGGVFDPQQARSWLDIFYEHDVPQGCWDSG